MIVDRASDALDALFRLMLLMLLNDSTLFWMVPPVPKALVKFVTSEFPTSMVTLVPEALFTSKSPHHAPEAFWSEMVSPCERLAPVVIVNTVESVPAVPAVAAVKLPAFYQLLEV